MLAFPRQGKVQSRVHPEDWRGLQSGLVPPESLTNDYLIENGKITQVDFTIPMVHNVMAIEGALRMANECSVTTGQANGRVDWALGGVVRACNSCSPCSPIEGLEDGLPSGYQA